MLLDFTEDIDPNTIAAGIQIGVTGTTMQAPPVIGPTANTKQVQAVLDIAQPAFTETTTIDFTLPKSTLRAVDGQSFDTDVSFQIVIAA